MAKEIKYEVKNTIGKLGEKSKLELRVVSWNDRDAKLDLRQWYERDGKENPGSGVTLTYDEAKTLVDLLTEYMNDDDDI